MASCVCRCREFGSVDGSLIVMSEWSNHSAVNRNVGGSNPPRGANSLVMQRVANIVRELCPPTMKCRVRESRLISINEDEGKSTGAGVSAVYQSIAVNRAQTKHSARNRMLASSQIGRRTRLPPKQECYQLSKVELNCVRRVAGFAVTAGTIR